MIDEAQELGAEPLRWLARLTAQRSDGAPVLQVCLVGHHAPRAIDDLQRSDEALDIGTTCRLRPLEAAETREYILHRLRRAGWTGQPEFTEEATDEIHVRCQGIPRRINLLANRVLLALYTDGGNRVSDALVRDVERRLKAELSGQALPPLPPLPAAQPAPVVASSPQPAAAVAAATAPPEPSALFAPSAPASPPTPDPEPLPLPVALARHVTVPATAPAVVPTLVEPVPAEVPTLVEPLPALAARRARPARPPRLAPACRGGLAGSAGRRGLCVAAQPRARRARGRGIARDAAAPPPRRSRRPLRQYRRRPPSRWSPLPSANASAAAPSPPPAPPASAAPRAGSRRQPGAGAAAAGEAGGPNRS